MLVPVYVVRKSFWSNRWPWELRETAAIYIQIIMESIVLEFTYRAVKSKSSLSLFFSCSAKLLMNAKKYSCFIFVKITIFISVFIIIVSCYTEENSFQGNNNDNNYRDRNAHTDVNTENRWP